MIEQNVFRVILAAMNAYLYMRNFILSQWMNNNSCYFKVGLPVFLPFFISLFHLTSLLSYKTVKVTLWQTYLHAIGHRRWTNEIKVVLLRNSFFVFYCYTQRFVDVGEMERESFHFWELFFGKLCCLKLILCIISFFTGRLFYLFIFIKIIDV